MTDARINTWTWIARVITLLGVLAGILAAAKQLPAAVHDFAALAVSMLGACAAWIYSFLPGRSAPRSFPPAGPAAVLVAVVIALVAFGPACANNAAGYRAVTITVKVGNTTGRTLAAACKIKRIACVEQHGAEHSVARDECLRGCRKALTAWTTIVRPAINTCTLAAFAGLETARQAKRTDATWVAKLRPGACALIRALDQWRMLLGAGVAGLLAMLGTVEDVACSK